MSLPIDLRGKCGLVVGVANEQSIAYGCARAYRQAGARLAISYQNDKAEPHVRPLAEQLGAELIAPLDVRDPAQLDALFAQIAERWGKLDFLLHSIAFAPRNDLHGRVVDCSAEGFALAMDVSCHSFIRLAKRAEPLMKDGGCLQTVSFYGAEKAISHYNLMGPVKAALESTVRYLAAELGPHGIRVHALSPGPLRTRAAGGLDQFDALLQRVAQAAPDYQQVNIEQVGLLSAYLACDGAAGLSGERIHIDGGYHVLG
ncbi:enoyl-ACP reductase FabI [Chitinimonas sp.]|uniref:enoyl-ACP reductase FabI n=1 Tax=Chitinimonas sp. TaxID=1934313 RepID=UPI0035AE5536